MTGVWLRRLALSIVVLVGLSAVMTARVITRGTAALESSDRAFDRGELESAVLEARTAALAYVPGAPHVSSAYERLAAIARGAEAEGRYALARTAWSSVERCALETGHWFDSRDAALEEARAGLGRLDRVAAEQRAGEVGGSTTGTSVARQQDALVAARSARGTHLVILALAFVLLAAGFAWGGLRGITAQGRTNRRGLIIGLVLVLCGASCWVLALIWG
jgi:hypothetical protein